MGRRSNEVVPFAREQTIQRFRASLPKEIPTLTADDLDEKLQEIEWVANDLVPRFSIEQFAARSCGISVREGSVIANAEFAKTYLHFASEFVNALLSQVHAKYPADARNAEG
jgi:hypothetical protein